MPSTATADAVKFRLLAQQLTGIEFNCFLSKLLVSFGKEILLTSLFNQFVNPSPNNLYCSQTENITKIISTIIKSRKIKPKKLTKVRKVSQFPKEIIGHISSFLEHKSLVTFSKANRAIFIGCNSPNHLQKLNLIKFKARNLRHYSMIKLQHFPSITHLKVKLRRFNTFTLPSNRTHNNLRQINLGGSELSTIDIQPFIAQSFFNFDTLQTLTCVSFGKADIPNHFQNALPLLSQFPMIRCLRMHNFFSPWSADQLSESNLKALFPNLIGFSFNGGSYNFSNGIIAAFGNTLRALSLSGPRIPIHPNVTFAALEELIILHPVFANMDKILQTANNLKKIKISGAHKYLSKPEMTETILSAIRKPSLIYLKIATNSEYFGTVCDAISIALSETKDLEREYFKLRLHLSKKLKISKTVFEKQIFAILNALIKGNVNDFMLILILSSKNTKEWIDRSKLNSMPVQAQTYKKGGMVITNRNCKLCGTIETFLAPLIS